MKSSLSAESLIGNGATNLVSCSDSDTLMQIGKKKITLSHSEPLLIQVKDEEGIDELIPGIPSSSKILSLVSSQSS